MIAYVLCMVFHLRLLSSSREYPGVMNPIRGTRDAEELEETRMGPVPTAPPEVLGTAVCRSIRMK